MKMFKKCGVLILSLALMGCGCGSSKKEDKPSQAILSTSKSEETTQQAASSISKLEQTTQAESKQESKVSSQEESSANTSETKSVNGIEFSVSPVPQDTTGNWKLSIISSNVKPQEYALAYYDTYMKGSNDVHFIINRADGTTTVINVFGNLINARVLKYISGEESSAKTLAGGDLIAEYWIDIDTGEIEEVQY